jgi:hypothetical protein
MCERQRQKNKHALQTSQSMELSADAKVQCHIKLQYQGTWAMSLNMVSIVY